jgi:YD repeat-containing protein
VWGAAAHNTATNKYIGQLKSVSGPGYTETYTLDALSRPWTTKVSADTDYYVDYSYNSLGAIDTLTYPTSTSTYRLKLKYGYSTNNGQPNKIDRCTDLACATTNATLWTADTADARNLVTQETLGSLSIGGSIVARRSFNSVSGLPEEFKTGLTAATNTIQNLSYEWDAVGNLSKRKDLNQGGGNLSESFTYDNLYRLTQAKVTPGGQIDLTYDNLGNIASKSGVGTRTYIYDAIKRHQVTSAGGIGLSYDPNGNVTVINRVAPIRTTNISWTSFNLPLCVRDGSDCSGTSSVWSKFQLRS